MSRQTDRHPNQLIFWPVSQEGRKHTMTTTYEEEEGSGGNNQPDKSHASTRKRKATEDTSSGEPNEKDLKRQKNREAAKKCRDRKIQETESLRKKNEELERENCQVVRQRDELMRRCLALEKQLQQHKEQGCGLPDLSPSCHDLSHILDPSTPPSPSFSGSSSLSPAPSEESPFQAYDASSVQAYNASPVQAYNASPVQAYDASPVQAYDASPVQAYNASPFQVYDASPVQGKSFETSIVGGDDIAKTLQLASSPENRKLMTPTPRMAVRVAHAAASTSSQPAVHPAQAISSQQYPFHYRDKDGSTKILQLDHENYVKVITNLKAIETESANQDGKQSDVAPVVCSPTSPPCQSLTTQQVKDELLFELVSDAEPFTGPECTAKTSAEISELDMFSSQHEFTSLLEHFEDDRMKEDLRLVDPNDIFMKKMVPTDTGSDQPTDVLLEEESAAFQQKVQDNICAADSNEPMISDQDLLAGQVKWRTDSDSFISADDPSLYLVQSENTDTPVTREDCSVNDQIITITVTDPKTSQVVQQSSSQYSSTAGKFLQPLAGHRRVFQPITPAPRGQTFSYASISANNLTHLLTSNTSGKTLQDVPIMLEKVQPSLFTKSVGKLPAQTAFDVSDYRPPTLDFLSKMKTVKLRSKATELLAPTSSLRVGIKPPSQSHHAAAAAQSWDGRGSKSSSMPLKELHIINSSQTSGFQPASFNVQPTYQHVDLSQDLLQPSPPQQMVSQMPVILLSQGPNQKNKQSVPGRSKTPILEADMRFTDSDRNLMDHLANALIDGDVFLE